MAARAAPDNADGFLTGGANVFVRDLLAIKNAGAYGYSMASNYNSRFRPAEVLIWNGKAQLIRKRDTLDDLLRNQVVAEI